MFVNQGKVYEIYARKVSHGNLFGFNEVKRTYLPMHSVLRIDEVKKQGQAKIVALEGSNVSQFPVPMYTPGGDSNARK
jgi:hypothetical protein